VIPNIAPVASIIGGSRTVSDSDGESGETVALTASASDSDGSIASTSWLVGGEVVVNETWKECSNSPCSRSIPVSLLLANGTNTVTFRATDDDGDSTGTSVTITVTAPEEEPASDSNEFEFFLEKESLEIKPNPDGTIASAILIMNKSDLAVTLSLYNPPGTRLEVEREIQPGNSLLHAHQHYRPQKLSNADNGTLFWFLNSQNGTIEVRNNGWSFRPYQVGDFVIPEWVRSLQSAAQENAAPVVSINLAQAQIIDTDGVAGEVVSVTATATDSDGELASTSWLIGDEVVASGTSARLALSDGSTMVTFRATDDDGDSKSTSVTITVEAPVETEEEFVTEYNGISAPSFLSEEINTVSVFDMSRLKLRSCIRLTLGGEPYSLNGYERYDMNFNLLSLDDLTFKLVDFRPFNLNGSRNQFGETPDCSGQFELSSNVYKDIIAVPGTTEAGNLRYDYYDLVLDLIDMDSLLFRLRDISIIAGAD
jgi:co-chaperonin GroES (HSP10)